MAGNMRFQDGVIPGFISDPANYVLMALNQARNAVRGTIEVLSYGRNKLQYKVEQAKPSAEERRSTPRSDMIGIRAQLADPAHTTQEQTKTVAHYMEKNKEWLVSNDWKSVRGNIKLLILLGSTNIQGPVMGPTKYLIATYAGPQCIHWIYIRGNSYIHYLMPSVAPTASWVQQ